MSQIENKWKKNIDYKKVLKITGVFVLAIYCFGLARPRYQVTSQFIIREPSSTVAGSNPLLGVLGASSNVNNSVEDGRYLEVYLRSPEVMGKLFLEYLDKKVYAKKWPDIVSGLSNKSNHQAKLSFYQKQVSVIPDETSGIISLSTTSFTPNASLQLNKQLIKESVAFVNRLNNTLGQKQYAYAKNEIDIAKKVLRGAIAKLTDFNAKNNLLNAEAEVTSTSNYITALEATLVKLKVEEGSLKRVYANENAPEIQAIRDQSQELTTQIRRERERLLSIRGRNLGGKASESMKLQQEVKFAEELLQSAKVSAEQNRMKSQQKVKLLILLSNPENPESQSWDWRIKLFTTILLGVVVINGISKFFGSLKSKH